LGPNLRSQPLAPPRLARYTSSPSERSLFPASSLPPILQNHCAANTAVEPRPMLPMTSYSEFKRQIDALRSEICREIYQQNKDRIRVKKEEVAVARLTAVFDGTLEISNRLGFQAMSVRDLSERTGISMGALYAYIESKDKLLDMILSMGGLATARVMAAAPEDLPDARARLRWLLRAHLYLTEAMQPWFYFSYMETKYFDRQARQLAMERELASEQFFADCLRDGTAQGLFQDRDPALTAALIKPLLQDWYLKRWKYRRRKLSVEAYADALIAFVEAAVLRQPAVAARAAHP
jgi:AcrR family transcriptional regulator